MGECKHGQLQQLTCSRKANACCRSSGVTSPRAEISTACANVAWSILNPSATIKGSPLSNTALLTTALCFAVDASSLIIRSHLNQSIAPTPMPMGLQRCGRGQTPMWITQCPATTVECGRYDNICDRRKIVYNHFPHPWNTRGKVGRPK